MAGELPGREPEHVVSLGPRRAAGRLDVVERQRAACARVAGQRRLRAVARRRAGLASLVRRLRDLSRPLRDLGARRGSAGLGGPARLERAADRTRAEHAARVVRRRPARNRAAARLHRTARSERALPDADLSREQYAPIRRDELRPCRPAARRRRGAPLAARRRALARGAHPRRPDHESHRERSTSGSSRRSPTPMRSSASCTTSTGAFRPATSPGSASRACRSSTGARPSSAGGWSA